MWRRIWRPRATRKSDERPEGGTQGVERDSVEGPDAVRGPAKEKERASARLVPQKRRARNWNLNPLRLPLFSRLSRNQGRQKKGQETESAQDRSRSANTLTKPAVSPNSVPHSSSGPVLSSASQQPAAVGAAAPAGIQTAPIYPESSPQALARQGGEEETIRCRQAERVESEGVDGRTIVHRAIETGGPHGMYLRLQVQLERWNESIEAQEGIRFVAVLPSHLGEGSFGTVFEAVELQRLLTGVADGKRIALKIFHSEDVEWYLNERDSAADLARQTRIFFHHPDRHALVCPLWMGIARSAMGKGGGKLGWAGGGGAAQGAATASSASAVGQQSDFFAVTPAGGSVPDKNAGPLALALQQSYQSSRGTTASTLGLGQSQTGLDESSASLSANLGLGGKEVGASSAEAASNGLAGDEWFVVAYPLFEANLLTAMRTASFFVGNSRARRYAMIFETLRVGVKAAAFIQSLGDSAGMDACHGDVTVENFLCRVETEESAGGAMKSEALQCCLGDLSSILFVPKGTAGDAAITTRAYRAPEIVIGTLLGRKTNVKKADVYSLGIVLIEAFRCLFCSCPPGSRCSLPVPAIFSGDDPNNPCPAADVTHFVMQCRLTLCPPDAVRRWASRFVQRFGGSCEDLPLACRDLIEGDDEPGWSFIDYRYLQAWQDRDRVLSSSSSRSRGRAKTGVDYLLMVNPLRDEALDPSLSDHDVSVIRNLLAQMLAVDPSRRLSLDQIPYHPAYKLLQRRAGYSR
uniref:Protein kinase domain-containing protein n=1 Tax=Chromera velia CCMP2878 TaxID=1169474 RepID=A0A0G4I3C2_9ALVE|eukprot:Cvel_10636.t1-p1 / transcript=Cvel_10636.t1 / gene=Cvel_10636 / organism=Chromera_velia_CCMP2878 / gene_product=hypothetical protein / transcript_product=hypothetical protein / location=Cvel_scaffold646:19433-24849(-) / protein_length=748 / sequence_SO=supercontig / SO=protein_coding / is_pseudo=false